MGLHRSYFPDDNMPVINLAHDPELSLVITFPSLIFGQICP